MPLVTEIGLPPFTAVPLVNDAPSAVDTGHLTIVTPSAYPDVLPIPVIGLLRKTNGDPLWLNTPVQITDLSKSSSTHATFVRTLPSVYEFVSLQTVIEFERLTTHCARKTFFFKVCTHVLL